MWDNTRADLKMSRNFNFVCVLLKSVLINTITYVLLSTKSLAYTRHGYLHTGQQLCRHFFLTSGQHEAGTWDPNYTPGVDFLDHNFL